VPNLPHHTIVVLHPGVSARLVSPRRLQLSHRTQVVTVEWNDQWQQLISGAPVQCSVALSPWKGLLAGGLLIDAAEYSQLPAPVIADLPAHGSACQDARTLLHNRQQMTIQISGPDDLVAELRSILKRSGFHWPPATDTTQPFEIIMTTHGRALSELARLANRVDPYLLAHISPQQVLIGPFVAMGHTACWGCALQQGAWSGSLHRPSPRADGATVVASDVWHRAMGLIVHDVVAFLEGRLPHSWSAIVEVNAQRLLPQKQPLKRDPNCSCSWSIRMPESA
jgi:hypothetical protein